MDKSHAPKTEEKGFSENLELLKRQEEYSKREIAEAHERKEQIIARAKEAAEAELDATREEVSKEKEKIIEDEVEEIEKAAAALLERAQKDAEKIIKSVEPRKVAEKLLPIVFK